MTKRLSESLLSIRYYHILNADYGAPATGPGSYSHLAPFRTQGRPGAESRAATVAALHSFSVSLTVSCTSVSFCCPDDDTEHQLQLFYWLHSLVILSASTDCATCMIADAFLLMRRPIRSCTGLAFSTQHRRSFCYTNRKALTAWTWEMCCTRPTSRPTSMCVPFVMAA